MLARIAADELGRLAGADGVRIDPAEAGEYLELAEFILSVVDEVDERQAAAPNLTATREERSGDDPLNAVVRWCSVRSECEGILSGKRIALKDSIAIAGLPMTCGSRILEGYVPERDAVVTERILRAGGEIVAITNMDDLAFSGGGDTSCYGYTRCPFDPSRTAGGSSSGSAAILWYEGVDAALGTDQGGSIRVPAAWCGVVGLKPTHGLVPYTGIAGIDQTFDHAGPLARSVEETALLLQAVAGRDESDPRQRDAAVQDYVGAVDAAPEDLRGVRIGIVVQAPGRDAVGDAVDRLAELGAELHEVSLPEHLEAGGIAFAGFVEGMTALVDGGGNGFHWAGRYAPDLARAFHEGLAARADELPPQVKAVLLVGRHLRSHYRGAVYAKAQNLRPWLRAAYDRALAGLDALLLPTTPGLPHPYDPELSLSARVKRGWALLANTCPTDMTGHPALTMPAAEAAGLPVGVMLVGRHFDDASLLAIARTYERRYGWLPAGGPPAWS